MKNHLIILLLASPFIVHAQEDHRDSVFSKSVQPRDENNKVYKINVKNYLPLLGSNFKQQVTSPFRLSGRQWLQVGGAGLITAGVILSDQTINQGVNDFRNRSGFIRVVSPVVTKFGGSYEFATVCSLGAYGLIFRNDKLKATTLLATQAYLLSEVWVNILKFVSGRERPNYYNPQTGENEGNWHGPFFQYRKNSMGLKPDGSQYSSFASGHSTAAFAVATVFAKQYRDKPVVQIISYSAASLVGLSRLTENKHWASDVLIGAALGYFSGRQVVGNYRRVAQSAYRPSSKKRNIVKFNLSCNYGVLMPGLTCTFR